MTARAVTPFRARCFYFSLLIPYVAPPLATQWHPLAPEGPFSVLSRGAFPTKQAARRWAKAHLRGSPYELKRHRGGRP